MSSVISLIPARGGSKTLPNKNLIEVGGQPLIAYAIQASQASSVNDTWVSTDSDEIKEVSQALGAKVILRPPHLSNDIIMPDAALVHFAEHVHFDYLVFIQPTSPLIKSEYIEQGICMVTREGFDSAFAAVEEHWTPSWTMSTEPSPINWDVHERPRRQDMPSRLREVGMVYVTKKQIILSTGLRYGGRIGAFTIPLKDSLDINTQDDIDFLRRLL